MQETQFSRPPRVSAEERAALQVQQALLEQQADALGIRRESQQGTGPALRESSDFQQYAKASALSEEPVQLHDVTPEQPESATYSIQPGHPAFEGLELDTVLSGHSEASLVARSSIAAETEYPVLGDILASPEDSAGEDRGRSFWNSGDVSTATPGFQKSLSQRVTAEQPRQASSKHLQDATSISQYAAGDFSRVPEEGVTVGNKLLVDASDSQAAAWQPEHADEEHSERAKQSAKDWDATATDRGSELAEGSEVYQQEHVAGHTEAQQLEQPQPAAQEPFEQGVSRQSTDLQHFWSSSSYDAGRQETRSLSWASGSAQPAVRREALDATESRCSEAEEEVNEEGEFSVDTEVVMAYTDDSVRHFLHAMELTDTLETFEREWEVRQAADARLSGDTDLGPQSDFEPHIMSNPLRESTGDILPTPRTAQLAFLQAELEATRMALENTRQQVSLKEQEALAATLQAQQTAAEAVAAAEQATEAARQQAAEAIHHARLAAAAAERHARDLQAMQLQQLQQQEQQRQQQEVQQHQQQEVQQRQQQEEQQLELQRQYQHGQDLQRQDQALQAQSPALHSQPPPHLSPSASRKDPAAKAVLPKPKTNSKSKNVVGASKMAEKLKAVASVRAAEAEERGAPSKGKQTPIPTGSRPVKVVEAPPADAKAWWLLRTVTAHSKSVAGVAVHPSKPIAVTASDDHTWRMWHLPSCEQIMAGEGHSSWVAGVDFHPHGTHLASASGDASVKLWSFAKQKCVATFKGHSQAVWGASWHDQGNFLASCSMDQSLRLWDAETGRARQIFRGHTDSVNDVCWQPFSGNICSASADNSICLWDARSGLAVLKLYGHESTCNSATFDPQGGVVASCDAAGGVRLWDVRKMTELHTLAMSPAGKAANSCRFDASGSVLAVASDAGKVVCYEAATMEVLKELSGHTGPAQATAFSHPADCLLTVGSDSTLRMWGRHP